MRAQVVAHHSEKLAQRKLSQIALTGSLTFRALDQATGNEAHEAFGHIFDILTAVQDVEQVRPRMSSALADHPRQPAKTLDAMPASTGQMRTRPQATTTVLTHFKIARELRQLATTVLRCILALTGSLEMAGLSVDKTTIAAHTTRQTIDTWLYLRLAKAVEAREWDVTLGALPPRDRARTLALVRLQAPLAASPPSWPLLMARSAGCVHGTCLVAHALVMNDSATRRPDLLLAPSGCRDKFGSDPT